MLYFALYPDSSHNTDILYYNSSIVLPERAILEELILRIALALQDWQTGRLAGGAIFSSILPSSTGSELQNIPPVHSQLVLCNPLLTLPCFTTKGRFRG